MSLLKAHKRRAAARELLSDGQDPWEAEKETKAALVSASKNTFESVAREWYAMKAKSTAPVTTANPLMYFGTSSQSLAHGLLTRSSPLKF